MGPRIPTRPTVQAHMSRFVNFGSIRHACHALMHDSDDVSIAGSCSGLTRESQVPAVCKRRYIETR